MTGTSSSPQLGLRYLGARDGAPMGYFAGAVTLTVGDTFPIGPAELIVGRRASASLRVGSAVVAPKHLRLTVDGDDVVVEDLRSTNGTQVDGVELVPHLPQRVAIGQQITVAQGFDFEVVDVRAE